MGAGGRGARNFLRTALETVLGRKPAEATLRDCDSFRDLFAKAPDAMALVDGNLLSETNPAWDNLFGYPVADIPGKPLSHFLPDAAPPDMGTLPPGEALGTRRDGTRMRLEVSAFPFPWQGRTLRVVTARDIAERKGREEILRKSEQSLRKSDGVLRTVLAHSPLVLFAFDKEGVFTVAEGKGLEAMEVKPLELQGQSVFSRPSPMRSLQGPVRRALEGREVDESVEIAGNVFEIHLRALTGGEGTVEGVMGLAVDVTERRRAEEDLRRSKEHLRTVISNAPIVLFALDAKGTFTLCEGRGLEAMGLKSGEAMGKSAFELFRHAPQVRMNVRRALSGEEFTSTSEVDGLWFETYFSPVFKGYDEVEGVIGVGINVTDRRTAEEALRRSEEQLRHSRKMEAIGRVAGGVAHDFNNLLTAITGYAELSLSGTGNGERALDKRARAGGEESGERALDKRARAGGEDNGERDLDKRGRAGGEDQWELQRKNLEEIRNAADRATVLTRQLLAFSRKQVLSPKALKLNQLLGEMDKMLRRLIREDIELVTVLDPNLGEVWADPGQMEQVILNLALNARDAMPGGGQVSLETENIELEGTFARGELFLVPGSYVMLSVSDTGIGMDEEVKAHLFEPFFTTKEEGKGLGLGLSAVYGIVKQSGGTISVESEKGRGTTFKVYLPRVDKEAGTQYAPASSDSLKGVETVLLVEDEEAVRTLVREILRMHGYDVLEARHGGEAILISQRHKGPIHMLLTDMVMANMSGKELAEHLKPLRPEMRVLFISGYSEEAVLNGPGGLRPSAPVEAGGRDGGPVYADAFLAKPFTPKTLATKVREVLDGKAAERRDLTGQF
ncbi:MAG: domain S-box protein [Fibrobacteres bacterium]|nr:domain S-box protein [Fibrobacterota bacterium]